MQMEAAVAQTQLTRSASLSGGLRRSRTLRFSPRVRAHLHRVTSDGADLARSAKSPLLRDILQVQVDVDADDGTGAGKGNDRSGRGVGPGGRGGEGRRHMGEYYRRVLRVEPENPLVLRNYGRYLQEVEGDLGGAEECYGRALLACPDDGELLSLYGQVVWAARQDKERAAAYLERAVQAAPDDCYVLGSYASFLWDAEEEDDGGELPAAASSLVPAC